MVTETYRAEERSKVQGLHDLLREDILSEIVRLLEARYYFSERVYYHHAKVAASAMVSRAVEHALAAGCVAEEDFYDRTDASVLDLLERAGVVSSLYHVLGGHLSPLDGIGPERLNIARLIERARADEVKEVLLALNATVEGQSTAHYLTEQLSDTGVEVSWLAQGVPIGGELDYLDEGTLAAAIRARKRL